MLFFFNHYSLEREFTMSDTFQKMMDQFNQPTASPEVVTGLQSILQQLNNSLLNLTDICKNPAIYLESLNGIQDMLPENNPAYPRFKQLQAILKADVECIDLYIKTAICRNKAITEMIEFGSADENELLAISNLAVTCLKINLMQAESCIKENLITLKLLRMIQTSIWKN